MCAIFGVIGENNPELIKKMSKVQEYRGPDKQNFLIEPNYNFCIGSLDYSNILVKIMAEKF